MLFPLGLVYQYLAYYLNVQNLFLEGFILLGSNVFVKKKKIKKMCQGPLYETIPTSNLKKKSIYWTLSTYFTICKVVLNYMNGGAAFPLHWVFPFVVIVHYTQKTAYMKKPYCNQKNKKLALCKFLWVLLKFL